MDIRVKEIDTLKAVAIIGVMIIHMSFFSRLSTPVMSVIEIAQALFGWSVMAFFFCSGVLMKHQEVTAKNVLSVLTRRAKRLLIPCLAFSVLYKTLLILISLLKLFLWKADIPSSGYEFFLFLFRPVDPQFYFLAYLFLISALIVLLVLLIRDAVLSHAIILSLFIAFYLSIPPPIAAHGPEINLIPAYTLCFSWGLLVQTKAGVQKILGNVLTCLSLVSLCYFRESYLFLYILIPFFLFHLFRFLPLFNNFVETTKLGKNSSAIYVWHAPLLLPFWSIVITRFVRVDFLNVLLIITATVVSCSAISEGVKQFRFLKPLRL